MTFRKYFVYADDGEHQYRFAVPAVDEQAARDYCAGNGEIVAVKDVTEGFPIDVVRVTDALIGAGFGKPEIGFICRSLVDVGIAS